MGALRCFHERFARLSACSPSWKSRCTNSSLNSGCFSSNVARSPATGNPVTGLIRVRVIALHSFRFLFPLVKEVRVGQTRPGSQVGTGCCTGSLPGLCIGLHLVCRLTIPRKSVARARLLPFLLD